MQAKTVMILFAVFFVMGLAYTASKGVDFIGSAISGFFISSIATMMIYYGIKKLKNE